jgi:predicted Zn-dependent protease
MCSEVDTVPMPAEKEMLLIDSLYNSIQLSLMAFEKDIVLLAELLIKQGRYAEARLLLRIAMPNGEPPAGAFFANPNQGYNVKAMLATCEKKTQGLTEEQLKQLVDRQNQKLEAGDLQKAEAIELKYSIAEKDVDHLGRLLIRLAAIYKKHHLLTQAEAMYRSVSRNSSNSHLLDVLIADVLMKQGRYAEARLLLRTWVPNGEPSAGGFCPNQNQGYNVRVMLATCEKKTQGLTEEQLKLLVDKQKQVAR